jgi:hypothetical protein
MQFIFVCYFFKEKDESKEEKILKYVSFLLGVGEKSPTVLNMSSQDDEI